MKDLIFKISTNKEIAKNTYEMVLVGDCTDIKCGQFVNIKIDGFYLRRPISVCCVEGDMLTLIYKVVGKGTEVMAKMENGGQTLDQLMEEFGINRTRQRLRRFIKWR